MQKAAREALKARVATEDARARAAEASLAEGTRALEELRERLEAVQGEAAEEERALREELGVAKAHAQDLALGIDAMRLQFADFESGALTREAWLEELEAEMEAVRGLSVVLAGHLSQVGCMVI
ncbi:hypothetical protein FOA52_006595 [Chlamydomonas sp. UWO 241]|nr:hypothetical protein FOA52_006595 [Chlamydomonas sp. UWO 241]